MKRVTSLCLILCAYLLFMVVRGAIAAEGDHKPQPVEPLASPRFIDTKNGIVTDKLTGLVWLKNANCFGVQPWDNAILLASSLANGQCGLSDGSKTGQWRLPNGEELSNLINHQKVDNSAWLNLQGFSKVQDNYYWTSEESTYSKAWFVDMRHGGLYQSSMIVGIYVWPVRSRQ